MPKKTKSKPSNVKARKKTVLLSEDGVSHVFDVEHIQLLEQLALGRVALATAADLRLGKAVESVLGKIIPDRKWISSELIHAYRVVEDGVDPLNSKATLGAGGRVNLGFSQLHHEFSSWRAMEGVYASLEKITAITEYLSDGLSMTKSSKTYELKAKKKSVQLVNFDMAVAEIAKHLPDINLLAVVAEIPFAAVWKYQKHPKVSQLIGNWLSSSFKNQSISFDGIIFSSTKNPSGKNIFITDPTSWTFTGCPPI